MIIHKILNNNVAVIIDEQRRERIVMGRGISFQKKKGSFIDPKTVDKIFSLSSGEASSRFQELVKDVPLEHIEIGEKIISEAKIHLGKKLNDMIYISLIDHIYTAILRFQDGITVKNVLLWDIRRFYSDEFQAGLNALDLIEQNFGLRLPEDEAGFIALHFANAAMDEAQMHNMYEITKIIQEISNIVRYYFKIEFDEDNVYYYRFITHLKFFAKRLIEKNTYEGTENDDLLNLIKIKYQNAFSCVEKITKFIEKKYDYRLSEEERLYLTIHIARVVKKI